MNRYLAVGLGLLQGLNAVAGADLVAHEWGTFTSMQGSNGHVLEGLQHEEEGLPAFVYSRNRLSDTDHTAFAPMTLSGADSEAAPEPAPVPAPRPRPPRPGCQRGCKGMEAFDTSQGFAGVTQKLETPVIYFYSPKPQRVNVNVEFPNGVISQWYPNAETFRPDIGAGSQLSNGAMSWSVDIANQPLTLPYVSAQDIWAPSRKVNSAFVKVGNENERFIFYRGLGHFDVPFEVWSTVDGSLVATNHSEQAIPAAFLLAVKDGHGVVQNLGAIPAHGSVRVARIPNVTAASPAMDSYIADASTQLRRGLEASGLYADEAKAMVDTWTRSYFKSAGLRVLYVVPREWTDRILPLHMTPEPRELVRTLVGRVEVFTAQEERQLQGQLQAAVASKTELDLSPFGRFAEAKLRRVLELTADPAAHAQGERLLKQLQ